MKETSSQSRARFCPGCGEPVGRNVRFCSACGKRLSSESVPIPARAGNPVAVRGARGSRRLSDRRARSVGGGACACEGPRSIAARTEARREGRARVVERRNTAGESSADRDPRGREALHRGSRGEGGRSAEEISRHGRWSPRSSTGPDRSIAGIWTKRRRRSATCSRSTRRTSMRCAGSATSISITTSTRRRSSPITRYLAVKPDDLNVRTDLGTMYLYGGEAGPGDRRVRQGARARTRSSTRRTYNLAIAYARKATRRRRSRALGHALALAPDERTRAADRGDDRSCGGGKGARSRPAEEPKSFQGLVEASLREPSHRRSEDRRDSMVVADRRRGRASEISHAGHAGDGAYRSFSIGCKGDLAARSARAARRTGALELVDDASGQVMMTVSSK